MPSREKIAGWLREAATSCGAFGEHSKAEKFRQRVAQVESMRCETCKHRCYTSSCSKYNQHILALDDGCFSYEEE